MTFGIRVTAGTAAPLSQSPVSGHRSVIAYLKDEDATVKKSTIQVLAALAVLTATARLHAQVQGPSTQQTPYVVPVAPGVRTISIASNGNGTTTPDETYNKLGGGTYRLVGIPDGAGAFDNGDGTFTMLVSHELGATAGINRAHGSKGAFVSKWVINKADLSVVGGRDLVTDPSLVRTYNTANGQYTSGTTAWQRFCSSDLAAPSAYYNAATGLGTQVRLFTVGEETSGDAQGNNQGRGFAFEIDGTNAGRATELYKFGNIAYENILASPFAQDKTVVFNMDDADRNFSSNAADAPSQLFLYVGDKTNSLDAIEAAGLTNGALYGVQVGSLANEDLIVGQQRFNLFNMEGASTGAGTLDVSVDNGLGLEQASIVNGLTQFHRIEDGVWDPTNEDVFYFVTTDTLTTSGGASQLWKVTFDDITNPLAGGAIEALTTGTEGYEMFDNLTAVDLDGNTLLLLQEDVGSNARLGKHWLYDTAADSLLELAQNDPARFAAPTAPFTRDEEASGLIPAPFLGRGWFLGTMQAQYSIAGELVRGGQLYAMYVPQTVPEPGSLALVGSGLVGLLTLARRHRRSR